MEKQELSKLKYELEMEGWSSYLNNMDVETVREVSEEYGCPECGGHHIHPDGMARIGSRPFEYRAFAVCDDCGHVDEF